MKNEELTSGGRVQSLDLDVRVHACGQTATNPESTYSSLLKCVWDVRIFFRIPDNFLIVQKTSFQSQGPVYDQTETYFMESPSTKYSPNAGDFCLAKRLGYQPKCCAMCIGYD